MQSPRCHWLARLLLLLLAGTAFGQQRRHFEFARTADFLEATNWRSRVPPCPRDTVRLPEQAGRPPFVGVSTTLTLRELRLPSSSSADAGEGTSIVLFDGARLRAFDESATSSTDGGGCGGGDGRIREAVFNLTDPLDWFRPGHWRRRSGGGRDQQDLFDLLPVDRLPGACDAVSFSESSVYFVRALGPAESIPVGQLEFAGRTFDSSSASSLNALWRESAFAARQFARSSDGSAAAAAVPPLTIAEEGGGGGRVDGPTCDVPLPVANPLLMERVCGGDGGCGHRPLECRHRIPAASVAGVCCDLCGSAAVASLRAATSGPPFSLRRLRSELAGAVRRAGWSGVSLSAIGASLREPLFQVVMAVATTDDDDTIDAGNAVVEEALNWLQTKADALHFTVVSTRRSYSVTRTSGLSSGAATGVAAAVTVCLLIVAAAAIAAIAVGRRRGWRSLDPRAAWTSWRQGRRRALQEEEAAEPAASAGSVSFTHASQSVSFAFTNPVYDVTQPQLEDLPVSSSGADREM